MKPSWRVLLCLALSIAMATVGVVSLSAQGVTTGALGGTVTDESGGALPGVTIEAVHEPTGTRYTAVTRADGEYSIFNVRVGGPYDVTASLEGFATQEQTDIFVKLGGEAEVDFRLTLGAIEDTVTVVGQTSPLFDSSRTGAASSVGLEQIQALPTVGRGLEDFARTNPFFTVSSENEDPDAISVAGRSSRYNNIQIDGAVNNDLFGLADQGTPGGQADATPISLDAIQEIELVLADYDVRQGGFSGGSVNAITRSGSNDLAGSVFYFTRDDGLVGSGPDSLGEFGTFEEDQYGFRLGGKIVENKMFFFVNGEITDRTVPTGWSVDGTGGQQFLNGDAVEAGQIFRDTLISRYGFDPGGLGEQSLDTPSDKFFGRLDFNIADNHQLTLRHNFVDAENDINRPGTRTFEFPSETYTITNETNSTVLQLNSVLGSNKFNEARITLQSIKDRRAGIDGVIFPFIEIENVIPGTGREFEAGTEPFSTQNALDQDVFEFTDDFTWIVGDHNITIGTHNEFFTFDNLFIQNFYGAYEFRTLDDFLAGEARRYRLTVVNPGQPDSQEFEVNQFGFYVGDQWAVRDNFTLTYGLRVDVPFFPDEPSRNPFTETAFGVRTDDIPDGEQLWQPRLGFNWDLSKTSQRQFRGGVGIFAGRAPYVWISNQYARTGVEQSFIEARNVQFNADPFNQPQDIGGASIGEFNFIDPDFQFPQVLRVNLAYDHELPWWGLVASIEGVYSDSQEEILYQNLNVRPTGATQPFDGRPIFETVDPSVTGAYLITNTSEGEQTNIAAKVEKPFGRGVWGFVSYTYGDSEVVNDGSSSRAVSNWQFNEALDPNNPGASRSDFEVEHRFVASLSYRFNRDSRYPTTASLFWNHQSGRPYSTTITGGFPFTSINGDGFTANDLFYVPSGPNDVELIGGTWEQLDAFISSDDCLDSNRGRIAPRNCSNAPWNSTLDLHLAQEIPIGFGHLEITADLLNLANLFDSDSGLLRFVEFNSITAGRFEGVTDDGRPIYLLFREVTDPENNPRFDTHNTRSRWRAKLGLRWTF
ncbi:MAG: carboxypeptidase regulatory-like domain-containing protein [Acidobacteriota bacterium]